MNTSQSTFRKLAKTAYLLGSLLLITGMLLGTFAIPAVAIAAIGGADQAGHCPTGWETKQEDCQNGCKISETQYIARVGIKAGAVASGGGCTEFSAPDTLPGSRTDGCYLVKWSADGKKVTFSRVGSGPNCKEISYAVTYLGEKPTATPTKPPVTPTETPLPTETPVETETPLPTETPVETETPLPTETPVETETPLPTEPPVETETPLPTEPTPVETETPLPTEPTPVETETPLPTEPTPVETETPLPTEPTPMDTETPGPIDTPTPVETETPLPTETPVATETVVETVVGTPITTETPKQEETEKAPATLAPPPSINTGVLIPVTGGDLNQTSPLASIQWLVINLGIVVLGLGLVLQGFSRRI